MGALMSSISQEDEQGVPEDQTGVNCPVQTFKWNQVEALPSYGVGKSTKAFAHFMGCFGNQETSCKGLVSLSLGHISREANVPSGGPVPPLPLYNAPLWEPEPSANAWSCISSTSCQESPITRGGQHAGCSSIVLAQPEPWGPQALPSVPLGPDSQGITVLLHFSLIPGLCSCCIFPQSFLHSPGSKGHLVSNSMGQTNGVQQIRFISALYPSSRWLWQSCFLYGSLCVLT